MVRYHIIFKGQVQNVGFRFFVKSIALENNLTGYAKNLSDYTMVEVELQGNLNSIRKTIKEISNGNIFIKVHDYSAKSIAIKIDERNFILYNSFRIFNIFTKYQAF